MSDLDAALSRISDLEDQCIALGDKVLYMLPVIDAARVMNDVAHGVGNEGEQFDAWATLNKALAALDALPHAHQPRQPVSTESD